jgi:hypothetical protein
MSTNGTVEKEGLTKREHFAALALQGLLASQRSPKLKPYEFEPAAEIGKYALVAVYYADALTAALEENDPKDGEQLYYDYVNPG